MRDWDVVRVASAAGARLVGEPVRAGAKSGPRRATIDSRRVQPGELFVGLRGEHADGGEYAAQALAAGAWGVLVAPEHAETAAGVKAAAAPAAAILAHPDPLKGLQSLARAWRRELGEGGAKVVAITGSTGKTSTKDILAALLSADRGVEGRGVEGRPGERASGLRTVASPENFNTEIGLPLAVLAAPGDTEVLVLEMAMRGAGQIAELVAIAEPDVGVIVNVGPVHLELLGSLEAIAAAKAELIAGLGPGAAVVVPVDEPLLAKHLRTDVRTITFGEGGDVALENYRPGQGIADGGSSGEAGMGGGDADGEVVIRAGDRSEIAQRISLRPSFGQAHNLRNLLAAVAAARALGVTPEGRVDVRFSALRGERLALPGGVVLIDDCYNANPMSMRAAIDDLAETATARRVAVLGDMLELGPEERSFHREIGQHAAARGVDVLVTVGPLAVEMRAAFAGTPGADGSGVHSTLCEAHSVPDARAAAQLVGTLLREGDTVLVKGSRGVGLEHVGQVLRARDPAHAPPAAPARARAGRR